MIQPRGSGSKIQVYEGEVSARGAEAEAELLEVRPSFWGGVGKLLFVRLAVLVIALALWEMISGRVIDEFWISKPSKIVASLLKWLTDAKPGEPFWTASLFFHLNITMQEMVAGFFFGALAGIVIGFALGQMPFVAKVVDPFIMAVYSLPKIALAPLFILWFGIGIQMKIVLGTTVVFFLVFWNTYAGIKEVDQDLVDVVKVMGAKRGTILTKVVLPSSLVWIFTGLKISIPYALIAAVVGEIIASNRGIGFLLMRASGYFDTHGLFAALFVLMIIGTILNEALGRAETLLMRWKVIGR